MDDFYEGCVCKVTRGNEWKQKSDRYRLRSRSLFSFTPLSTFHRLPFVRFFLPSSQHAWNQHACRQNNVSVSRLVPSFRSLSAHVDYSETRVSKYDASGVRSFAFCHTRRLIKILTKRYLPASVRASVRASVDGCMRACRSLTPSYNNTLEFQ